MKKLVILGSTGSIGRQTLDIVKEFGDIEIVALACGKNIDLLESQIKEFNPKYVSTKERCEKLEKEFPQVEFHFGDEGLVYLSSLKEEVDVLNCLVGSAGLVPTLTALKHHHKVLLSNKETLVIGGELVKEYLKKYNGTLYPIDSEHTGLWELIDEVGKDNIESYTITASGGAFRDTKKEDLKYMKASDALKHPNWSMGRKITIDSATMMNKAFELIEAHYLFDIPMNKINAVIEKTSSVHAYVTLKDGSIRQAVNRPSMRNPIIRALYYPLIKYENEGDRFKKYQLDVIDKDKFPCITFAEYVMDKGGLYPTILNAANEEAVYLYLDDKISYSEIYEISRDCLIRFKNNESLSLKNILKYDKIVKDYVKNTYLKEE